MRRLCVFALFVLSSATWGAEGTAFHLRPPVPGSKTTVTSGGIMEIAFQGAPAGKTTRMRNPEIYKTEVLEARDKAATKIRVHYLVSETNTDAKRKVKPLAGKTYIVTAAGNGVEIVREGGGAPPKPELDSLKGEFGSLGKPDPLCAYLDGKTLAPGEGVNDPSVLTSLLGSFLEGGKVDSFAIQLREIHARRDGTPAGLFGFHVKASIPTEDGLQIAMSSGGTLEIALDPCRLLSMEMAGPAAVAGAIEVNGKQVSVLGSGTTQVNILVVYK
jgi:hypothetical protein